MDIFDIATSTWYTQPTTVEGHFEHPSELRTQACSVVASAPDRSSHNIYLYGGNRLHEGDHEADVYVLSIPSFHWIKVGKGTPRAAHKCALVQGKYMVSYRGDASERTTCATRSPPPSPPSS